MNHQPLQKNNQTAYEPTDWLTGRLAGSITGSIAGSRVGWLDHRLHCCLADWLARSPARLLARGLAGSITGSIAGSRVGWLTNSLTDLSDNEQDKYRNEMAMNDQPLQKNNQTAYEPADRLDRWLAG